MMKPYLLLLFVLFASCSTSKNPISAEPTKPKNVTLLNLSDSNKKESKNISLKDFDLKHRILARKQLYQTARNLLVAFSNKNLIIKPFSNKESNIFGNSYQFASGSLKKVDLGFFIDEENVVFYCDNAAYFEQPLESVSENQLRIKMQQILYQKLRAYQGSPYPSNLND